MFLALMLSALIADPTPLKAPAQQAASTVRISLSHDGYFELGDRVTARVTSSEDGYLVVFRATTRGRVRVLFPLDPGLDNFVRGGKTYEVVGRGGKESFSVDDEEGSGVVYAAVAEDPLQFNQFVRGDHWDYRAFGDYQVSDDAEAVFGDLMEKMVAGGRYQFDLVSYHVGKSDYSYDGGYSFDGGYSHDYAGWFGSCFGCGPYYGGPYYGGAYYGSGFSISIGFGAPFYSPFYPYYFGGFYDPFYSPWYWNSWYSPYYYPGYRAPYYTTCYVGPCGGYNSGPYYSGRPPYTFKPGVGGTPVDYRPRFRGSNSGAAIGVTPRDRRNPVDSPGRTGPGRVGTPVSHRDDGIGIGDGPRRRVGVADRSARQNRPTPSPNPGDGSGSSAVPRRRVGVGVDDRSGRPDVSGQDGSRSQPRGDNSSRRAQPSSRAQSSPRADSPRRAEPSQGRDAPRRAQSQSGGGGGGSYPSYRPQSGGQSGGGSARPSGGGYSRRRP